MLLCQCEWLAPCYLVLPGGLVGVHGSVDHIDEVAFKYSSGAAGTLRRFSACDQLLGGRVEACLHDRRRVKDAVETAIAASVKSVTFVVR